jgi:DNA-binding IclR family transcriptional regulator
VAWMDCQRHTLHAAGDHDIVIGEVKNLRIEAGGLPLLFFQGGYGRFLPGSLAANDPLGALTEPLRDVDIARPFMESLTDALAARCIATVLVKDEVVVAASAGRPMRGAMPTLVGQRFPYIPPTSAVFAAWQEEGARRRWLAANAPPERARAFEEGLIRVRARGFSLGLVSPAQREFAQVVHRLATARDAVRPADMRELMQSLAFEPPMLDDEAARAVRLISVPVLVQASEVALALTLCDFPKPAGLDALMSLVERMRRAADDIAAQLGAHRPEMRS